MTLTTVLDLAGALLLILGISLFVGAVTVAGGVATAGLLLLALSWILDRRVKR